MNRPIRYDKKSREQLEYLANMNPEEFMKRLPTGISLVEPPFPDASVSCEQYTIGTDGFRHSIAALYPKLHSLAAGDIVLYWEEDRGTVHIGRLQEDGLVISKWGNGGPVLRHPVDMVPLSYGEWVFFRRIPEEELHELRGKNVCDLIS